jgi:hypothetical protein
LKGQNRSFERETSNNRFRINHLENTNRSNERFQLPHPDDNPVLTQFKNLTQFRSRMTAWRSASVQAPTSPPSAASGPMLQRWARCGDLPGAGLSGFVAAHAAPRDNIPTCSSTSGGLACPAILSWVYIDEPKIETGLGLGCGDVVSAACPVFAPLGQVVEAEEEL